jgi:hypothetical protein
VIRWALVAALLAIPANYKGLERPASQGDLLRAFAFARCLGSAYEGTQFGADADWVASTYSDMMTATRNDQYSDATKLAARVAKEGGRPAPYEHKNMAIMWCLEFYESRELKGFAKKVR